MKAAWQAVCRHEKQRVANLNIIGFDLLKILYNKTMAQIAAAL